jgi:predicted transposase YbfD/YdcC
LSPDWSDNVLDTTPTHKNKTVPKAKVLHQLFWGMLTGRKNLRDIETQSEIAGERIADTTMTGILERLDVGKLPNLIAKQVKQAAADKELRPQGLPFNMVAIDGKNLVTRRGKIDDNGKTEPATKRSIMALRATLVSSSIAQVLGQRLIPGKSSETTELIPFLKEQNTLYGKTNLFEVVSVDAGMTHLKNADYIHENGMIYVMGLKRNQRALFRIAQSRTKNLRPVASSIDTHGGYEIVREISVVEVRGKFNKWSHATEIWKIEQTKTHKTSRKIITETRYYITNMPKGKASSKEKLLTVRRHWGTENDAFWTLDTIFDEDSSPFTSSAIELVSLIRIMAFNIMARFRGRRLKSTRHRALRWNDFIQFFQTAFALYFAKPLHPI